MNKPVLVVMAAGMGSRYGGMKQPLVKHRAGHRSTISLPAWRWGLLSLAC